MKRGLGCGPLLLAVLLGLPSATPAYTVEPNLLKLGMSGGDSSAFVRVANPAINPAAVEIVINEFGRDLEGRGVIGQQADDDFIVYPAQMILMPGDEASVQVRWIGEAASNVERAFSLTTREVPIPRKDQEQSETSSEGVRLSVNVLMNYDVRVYVTPRGARPRVTVESVAVRPQSEAAPAQIEVTLANEGTAHHALRDMSLILTPLDPKGAPLRQSSVRLEARDVPGMSAALLAGGRRRLLIPWPVDLPAGPVRAVLAE